MENDEIFYKIFELEEAQNAALDALAGASGVAGQPREATATQRRPNSTPEDSQTKEKPRPRNTKRGLRNLDTIEARKKKRSMKRNIARRLHRRNAMSSGARARELPPHSPRLSLGTQYKLASLNVRGLKVAGQRK